MYNLGMRLSFLGIRLSFLGMRLSFFMMRLSPSDDLLDGRWRIGRDVVTGASLTPGYSYKESDYLALVQVK